MSKGSLPSKLVEPKVVEVGKQREVDDGEGNISAGEEEETLSFRVPFGLTLVLWAVPTVLSEQPMMVLSSPEVTPGWFRDRQ